MVADTAVNPWALRSPLGVWIEAVRGGVSCLTRDPSLGVKKLMLPVSYWRTAEFAYVCRNLRVGSGAQVLDLGSPKDLAVWLARRRHCAVRSTDILQEEIDASRRYASARSALGEGPGLVSAEVQDGRALTFADARFDAAYSVSVVEHIPEDGDCKAISELVRVVKPGGQIVVTVPFAARHRDTFVERRVYERGFDAGHPVFYQRHYDADSLRARLLSVSGARVTELEIWGERGIRVERLLERSRSLRFALSPLEPLLAMLALRRAGPGVAPMAAFFTLERAA
jgi:SAM-dependent methyltransferase